MCESTLVKMPHRLEITCHGSFMLSEKRKHLPLLETDGNKLSQSYAVARYLAREFGKFEGVTRHVLSILLSFA